MSTSQNPEAPATAGAAQESATPATGAAESSTHAAPEASPAEHADASGGPEIEVSESDEGDEGEGEDEGAEAGPQGPEGPGGAGEGGKKKKRRRKKKPSSAGPEGPPIEAQGPAGPEGAPREKREKREKKPNPNRPPAAFQIGEEVFGKVTSVLEHAIMVDLAGKALAIFDRGELAADDLVPSVGDRFVAQVLGDGSRGGLVVLTRKPLREEEAKPNVEKAFNEKTTVEGLVTGAIKGGLEVYVDGLRAFAPASHVDLKPGADLTYLLAQRLPFFVEQYAKRGRDVVLSRKAIIEEDAKKVREESLGKLKVGEVVKGIVKSVVQWGAFVAIPEADDIEGLVHVTELAHDPRTRPQDAVKVGDEIQVKIQRIDERGKLWLSKKATEPDPWEEMKAKYAPHTRHKGKVTRIQPFGAFVELEPGLDGLIRVEDLSIKRVERVEDVVKPGQEIDVVVASMDPATKKIGLHPAPPPEEADIRQRVQPHKSVKFAVVSHESAGLICRILGQTGRYARAFLPAGQTGTPRGTDLRKLFPAGSTHEGKVLDVDPKRGEAKLSIKALREDSEKSAYNEYRKSVAQEAKFGTFADLLKPKT